MNRGNVPQLRFGGFEGEWKTSKLNKFASLNPKNSTLPDSFVYIDLESVTDGFLIKENTIVKEEAPSRAQRILRKKDILFQTVRPYQQNNLYFNKDGDYVASTGYAQIRTENDTQFLFQFLHTERFVTNVMLRCTGTSYPAINSTDLSNIEITFPTLPEQQKIATFLTAVDEKIQQLSRKKELLNQYKKGVMQQLFSGKLRFKDADGKDFSDWEEKKLGDFKNLVHGDGDWILSENIDVDEKYSIIQLANVGFGKFINKPMKTLSEKNFKVIKGTLIEYGDLLINRMVDVNLNACVFEFTGLYVTSVDVCWIRTGNDINNVFFLNLILTEKYQKKLLSLSSGSGRVRISKTNFFDKFYFELPCMEEQQKIADFLSSIDTKIDSTNQHITQMQSFKKGLLQQMFV